MLNNHHVHVAVVGTGFAGLGMAIKLKQEGIEDFVVLERAGEVGGTWRDNTYPGCACDVPSHLYSFSFAPNPNWSRSFSPQPEIKAYLQGCAERYGLMPHIRFHHEMRDCRWDAEAQNWVIDTSQGTYTASFVVAGTGPLSEPSIPALPGMETFAGTTFHSATWDHDHDLTGEKVAVIGTGASAIQFVPQIQPQVDQLTVFQRTAPWIMPRRDRAVAAGRRRLFRRLPSAQLLVRALIYWSRELSVLAFMRPKLMEYGEKMARRHLESQVPDPALRAKLIPNYSMGCKRVLLSDDYYPALAQPNVDVVTAGIKEVRPHAIVTADDVEHPVDTIILGTGFHVTDMKIAEQIRDGEGVALAERWKGSPQAYRGTTVAGYPNLFLMVGPNTGLGHNSIVFMIESQVNYIADCLRHLKHHGLDVVDAKPEVQAQYNAGIQQRMEGTVWTSGGCASWYLDANGRNTTLWPGFTWPFRSELRTFDPAAYTVTARASERVSV